MTTSKKNVTMPANRSRTSRDSMATGAHPYLAIPMDFFGSEQVTEWAIHGMPQPGPWYPRVSTETPKVLSESTQIIDHMQSRLDSLKSTAQAAVDIGLENRNLLNNLLEELHEGESRVGLGAIHSLNQGRVQLNYPLVYGYQVVENEVVVGIEDLGVYGVGATESQAVEEMQQELWSLFNDLEQREPEKLGARLTAILRTLRARIQRNAMDA